jgi:hypothetical protein
MPLSRTYKHRQCLLGHTWKLKTLKGHEEIIVHALQLRDDYGDCARHQGCGTPGAAMKPQRTLNSVYLNG